MLSPQIDILTVMILQNHYSKDSRILEILHKNKQLKLKINIIKQNIKKIKLNVCELKYIILIIKLN